MMENKHMEDVSSRSILFLFVTIPIDGIIKMEKCCVIEWILVIVVHLHCGF